MYILPVRVVYMIIYKYDEYIMKIIKTKRAFIEAFH